jgi:hypothetical protein
MKPRLPREIELLLPPEIVHLIYQYLEPVPKAKNLSGLQREVEKLQKSPKKQTAMYLKGLDDFILK